MLTAITGINWGDEGKGRMVDLLCRDYDIVARYQGGDNAGHTVKNECGKFVLNLVPSGILHPSIVCVMGGGMVIDPEHLEKEIAALREQGVKITPDNLKISDRATITMPFHVEQDGLEEARLAKTGACENGQLGLMPERLRFTDHLPGFQQIGQQRHRFLAQRGQQVDSLMQIFGFDHQPDIGDRETAAAEVAHQTNFAIGHSQEFAGGGANLRCAQVHHFHYPFDVAARPHDFHFFAYVEGVFKDKAGASEVIAE